MTESNNRVYIGMMRDSLKTKKEILIRLLDRTKEQEELLSSEDMDVERFEELLEEKGDGIDELNRMDEGFDSLFKKLEQELKANRSEYEDEIKEMKKLIGDITDLSTKIQMTEKRNNEKFQKFLTDERKKIREGNKSQQTAMTYLQNMGGYHKPGDSYFVNETK